ncbi:MAG: hypothetical protein HXL58_00100 [Solobacterium sp.]|nr:hypothetical protein [Solobacterium sp.]
MSRVNLELLSSALTIVIADTIVKPDIEVNGGSVKIVYKVSDVVITKLSTMFELEHSIRLDFFVDSVRLDIKHKVYNALSGRYVENSL